MVKLTIDGREVVANAEETILQCALRHEINIPHLCTHPALPPYGGCRLCVVEVEGMRGFPTSCTTPAAEGMVVQTNTEPLREMRRNTLGLMMLEHPNACLVCGKRELCEEYRPKAEKAGRTTGCHTCNNKEVCEVRVLSEELGHLDLPVPPLYHNRPLDRTNPFIDRDLNLCILCGRCVRICKHQHGRAVIDLVGRSSETYVSEAFGRSLVEAGCSFCGSCVDVCPTGSLSDRFAKWYGRADTWTDTTCAFCEAACALSVGASEDKPVSAKAVDPKVALCLLGRFALAEFHSGTDRLRVPKVRVGSVLREIPWPEAIQAAAGHLAPYKENAFAFVCDTTSTVEDRFIFRKFTKEVMGSDHYIEIEPDSRGVSKIHLPEGVEAAFLTGDFVASEELENLKTLIVQDCYPTHTSSASQVVFPAAIFAEIDGTTVDGTGQFRPLNKSCNAPGNARAEWRIVSELAQAMGGAAFEFDTAAAVSEAAGCTGAALWTDREEAPAPAHNPKLRRAFYRGHRISDKATGLTELPMDGECRRPAVEALAKAGRFPIVAKQEIVPNTHELVIKAPEIAKKAQAGQFVIVMADQTAERVPYTLCDWDAEAGTITLVVLEKGQSSRKLILKEAGDSLAHVVGPLGIPFEVKNYGTVAVTGGCYGIGGIVSIAKALKAAGNTVISITEARSHYLHYYGKKLAAIADEAIQTTIDGSVSPKGHAVDALIQRLEAGKEIDCVVAIGCPFMMMLTADATRPYEVPTWAALNPIMLDGTGMCGACRLSVGSETKFACVDGPFFNAHLVDWIEVRDRREAYSMAEIQSVGRTESVTRHKHTCACNSNSMV